METNNKNLIKELLKQCIELLDEESTDMPLRDKVINIAKKYIGKPYVWAGNGPDNFDCGGFTQYVYREAGLIPNDGSDNNSEGQRRWGKETTNPRPGDLICYNGHVAIYLNENEIIHASKNAGKVIIANKNIGKPVLMYRNIIGD